MNLTTLFQALLTASEFTSANSLANHLGLPQPLVARMLTEDTKKMQDLDRVMEALTPGIEVEEFIAALELVSTVRRLIIEKEQIL